MKTSPFNTRHVVSAFWALLIFTALFFSIDHLASNETTQDLAAQFGYLGVLITGVIAGLNSFVPVPAAAFTPIFVAAGLSIPFIILALAIGTLIADFMAYILGHVSRKLIIEKHPKIFSIVTEIHTRHQKLVLPLMAAYAAFVPFPNEALIIPLALSGMRFTHMAAPLIIGNLINQTLYTYSILSLSQTIL